MSTLEIVARNKAGGLELRQDTVDRGQANIFTRLQQLLVDILSAHVTRPRALEDFENFQSRQSDFQPGFAKFFSLLHEQTLSRYDARLL
jgi:hypothetical protein